MPTLRSGLDIEGERLRPPDSERCPCQVERSGITREEFRAIRKLSGLNQADFGKILGIDQRTVSAYEDVTKKGNAPGQVLRLNKNLEEILRVWQKKTKDGNALSFGERLKKIYKEEGFLAVIRELVSGS